MNRLIVVASIVCCALAAAACGSSTAPKDVFSGTWKGLFYDTQGDTDTVTVTAAQTGSTISGSGTVNSNAGQSTPVTLSGTSTPPTLNITISATGSLEFAGTYATADSVSGTVSAGGTQVAVGFLKKQ